MNWTLHVCLIQREEVFHKEQLDHQVLFSFYFQFFFFWFSIAGTSRDMVYEHSSGVGSTRKEQKTVKDRRQNLMTARKSVTHYSGCS